MAGVTDPAWASVAGIEAPSVEHLADRWAAAWNSHESEKVLSLLTDDVVYDDSSWPTQMQGHDQVRAFLDSTWRAVPDLTFTTEAALQDESGTMTARYWHATATHTGTWEPPGLDATDRRLGFHGATFIQTRDGKLCRIRVVYDVADIMRQLGVLPAPGELSERLFLLVPNLRSRLRRR